MSYLELCYAYTKILMYSKRREMMNQNTQFIYVAWVKKNNILAGPHKAFEGDLTMISSARQ
jgi:hypothetical protein